MLNDLPYSKLQQDERAYEIMMLRDQHGNAFTDIAKEYGISVARASQIYDKIKIKQIRLYIHHIAAVLEHQDNSQVKKVYDDAYECFRDWTYVCAYLEKRYRKILEAYRAGEPGMPLHFMNNMPPYKRKLSKKAVARIVEMREAKKAPFATIAKELHITQKKARVTYEWFYHGKALALVKALQEKAEGYAEKMAIWNRYFKGNQSSKKRYDMLMMDKAKAPADFGGRSE